MLTYRLQGQKDYTGYMLQLNVCSPCHRKNRVSFKALYGDIDSRLNLKRQIGEILVITQHSINLVIQIHGITQDKLLLGAGAERAVIVII